MNIKQIAKAAGVSVATVSRVMNHPESVAAATREKIQKIMDEEEYTPNWFARGLNFNRTKTIGLVIPHTINSNYMEIANGVEEVARQKGYITFMCNMEKDSATEKEYIDQLITRKVDGLILMFSLINEEYASWIDEEKIPTVLIGGNDIRPEWSSVTTDCRKGAANMTAHLLDCGYRKIAFLCGTDPRVETSEMLKGFRNVMKAGGAGVDEKLILDVENNIEGGYIGMKRLLGETTPDAVFASSDEIAFGALDALKDSGLRIPEDVAVAGFGNNRMSGLVEPKLTTVEQPFRKMGIYGARILFDMIEENESKSNEENRHIVLQTKLRIRKSCGHEGRIGEMF